MTSTDRRGRSTGPADGGTPGGIDDSGKIPGLSNPADATMGRATAERPVGGYHTVDEFCPAESGEFVA